MTEVDFAFDATRKLLILALLLAALAAAAGAATFEQISPGDGFSNIEFEHLAVNGHGQFVAVSQSNIYVGETASGRITRVLANDRLGFLLEDTATQTVGTQSARVDLAILGTRLALNGRGDYVVASHTKLFVGNVAGGEPRKVYEDAAVMFHQVLINDAGHYLATTRRGLVGGTLSDSLATRLMTDASGTFHTHDLAAGPSGIFGAEVGQTHLALNSKGQFIATSTRACYGGSVPARTVTKIFESSKVGFRHVALNEDGGFVAVSARNVYRGKL